VLWPPALFAAGVCNDDAGTVMPNQELRDEDLGPGGAWITRWGADPLNDTPVDPAHFGPLIDPKLIEANGERVPRAQMPIPVEGASEVPGVALTTGSSRGPAPQAEPDSFLPVALQTYEPRFDPQEELWYVDVGVPRTHAQRWGCGAA
jgi:hypothetical protein